MAKNALQLSKNRLKKGGLTWPNLSWQQTENRRNLLDMTKKNIQDSWWDREAWLAQTRKQLSSTSAPRDPLTAQTGTKKDTTVATGINQSWWAEWYGDSDILIPGVNMPEPNKTRDWIIKKPPVFASKTETAPIDGIDTKWTWTSGLTWETGAWQDYKSFDTNKDGIINENELSWDYKTFYDGLSDNEKRLFLATGENAMKNNLDIAESYANYMRDYKTTKTRKEEDEAYRLNQQWISEEFAQIQESQTMRRAKDWVDKLKQSIAYLWDLGMPWKSSQRIVNVENQVAEAEKSLQELWRLQSLASKARSLWKAQAAAQYERQMEDITTKLNDDVDKSIQDAFNGLTEADNNGKLDTVEELTAFRDKMYQDLDASITGFSDASIEQLRFLSGEVNNAVKEAATYQANEGKINQDMSALNKYYTNANNQPILWSNWQRIPYQEEAPASPIYDKASWRLITFYTDENGAVKANVDQVIDEPTFTEQTISDYANLVSSGKLKIGDVPESIKSNANFLSTLKDTEATTTTDGNWKEDSKGDLYNTKTWEYKDSVWNIIWQDTSVIDFSNNKELINKYPNEASFKNNNPTGITFQWMSDELQSMFDEAGVQYEMWTSRPSWEGGNYVKFNTVQDGLDAYTIALTQRWDDVYDRLVKWVWTDEWDSYAKGIMSQAWIEEWTKFNQLDQNQLWTLMSAQLKKESPNYYNELSNIPEEVEVSPTDIMTFNSSTFKPQKDLETDEDKARYSKFLKDKRDVMKDKDADIQDILEYSAWWKDLSVGSIESITKFDSVISQLWDIQSQISKMDTWPILWKLKKINPYDTDAQTLKAQLTALIPNLARWVYGEVWVLTDNDIRLYSKTIPNLESPNDVNKAILAMTLKVVGWGYKKKLQSLAAAGRDVSWFSWLYDNLQWQVDSLESQIEWAWEKSWGDSKSIKNLTSKYFGWNSDTETVNTSTWAGNTVSWAELSEEDLYNKYY